MNKHLRVEVNGQEWVNGEFAEISFTDGPGGVRIEGKPVRQATGGGGGGGGLLDLLTQASRARTQAVVEEKRAELADAEVVDVEPVKQD